MASVFKRGGDGKHGGTWYIAWFDQDGQRQVTSARTSDKATAERIAAKKEGDAALRRDGVIDPRQDRFAIEDRRSLDDHLTDYVATLKAQKRNAEYIKQSEARARRVIALCNAKTIGDLTQSAVQTALGKILKAGKSHATLNAHIRSIKALTNWLCTKDKRTHDDALKSLSLYNEAEDPRRSRREVTPDELAWLLATTEPRTLPQHRVSGEVRAMAYRIALGTGYRASEIKSLRRSSFDLGESPTVVTCKATHSKRRRLDVQPIRNDLADALRPWLARFEPEELVFQKLPGQLARMLRPDLEAARLAWIEAADTAAEKKRRQADRDFLAYQDSAGCYFDFHSCRHTFISAIVNSGASVKVAQELARHSSPMLTIGRYSHTRRSDLRGALNALPVASTRSACAAVRQRNPAKGCERMRGRRAI